MAHDERLSTSPRERAYPPSNSADSPILAGRALVFGLVFILLGGFMELLDVTVVTVALPKIQTDLHASYSEVQWALAGFQLAFAVGLITGGRLGDIYGHKRIFIIGVIAFTCASVLCGAAPGAISLNGARVIQGFAAALMFPQVLSIIQIAVPPSKRALTFGLFGATTGIASIAGPLIGGVLINANVFGWGWRSIFLINVPVGVVCAIGAYLVLKPSRSPEAKRLDIPGALIASVALFMLVYALIEGHAANWAWWIWVLMIGSLPILGLFYLQQRRIQDRSPLLDLKLFNTSGGTRFGVGMAMMGVYFAGISGVFLVLSVFFETGAGFTPLHTSVAYLPLVLATLPASGMGIRLIPILGKVLLQIGLAIIIAGMFLFMYLASHHPTDISIARLWPAEIVIGFGFGLGISTINNLALAEARGPNAGSASGIQLMFGQVGNAFGVAVLGVIFFGLLGGRAVTSAEDVAPALKAQLTAAAVPATTADRINGDLGRCLHDFTNESDPSKVPASCGPVTPRALATQVPGSSLPRVVALVSKAQKQSVRRDFSSSISSSLYYEVVVFGLVFLLVFAMPWRRGPELAETAP